MKNHFLNRSCNQTPPLPFLLLPGTLSLHMQSVSPAFISSQSHWTSAQSSQSHTSHGSAPASSLNSSLLRSCTSSCLSSVWPTVNRHPKFDTFSFRESLIARILPTLWKSLLSNLWCGFINVGGSVWIVLCTLSTSSWRLCTPWVPKL